MSRHTLKLRGKPDGRGVGRHEAVAFAIFIADGMRQGVPNCRLCDHMGEGITWVRLAHRGEGRMGEGGTGLKESLLKGR